MAGLFHRVVADGQFFRTVEWMRVQPAPWGNGALSPRVWGFLMTDADARFRTLAPGEGPLVGPTEAEDFKEEFLRVQGQLAVAIERSSELIENAVDADAAKREFCAHVSNGIRTPLNAIIRCTEILTAEPITEEQRRYVDIIRSSAQQLLNLAVDGMAEFLCARLNRQGVVNERVIR